MPSVIIVILKKKLAVFIVYRPLVLSDVTENIIAYISYMQTIKEQRESPMNEDVTDYCHLNGNSDTHRQNSSHEMVNGNKNMNGNHERQGVGESNGDSLIKHVDHIYLSGEEEEKR